eukprot:11164580-Lingulodinium_polyedra.AAC.1
MTRPPNPLPSRLPEEPTGMMISSPGARGPGPQGNAVVPDRQRGAFGVLPLNVGGVLKRLSGRRSPARCLHGPEGR